MQVLIIGSIKTNLYCIIGYTHAFTCNMLCSCLSRTVQFCWHEVCSLAFSYHCSTSICNHARVTAHSMQKARHTSSSWRRCLARHSQRHEFQKLDMSEGSPLSPLATAFMEVCLAQSEISRQCVRGAQASGRALFVQVCTFTQQELEPTACTSALAFSGSIMVERCVWHHVDIARQHLALDAGKKKVPSACKLLFGRLQQLCMCTRSDLGTIHISRLYKLQAFNRDKSYG